MEDYAKFHDVALIDEVYQTLLEIGHDELAEEFQRRRDRFEHYYWTQAVEPCDD